MSYVMSSACHVAERCSVGVLLLIPWASQSRHPQSAHALASVGVVLALVTSTLLLYGRQGLMSVEQYAGEEGASVGLKFMRRVLARARPSSWASRPLHEDEEFVGFGQPGGILQSV
ncbi:hypothetical protein C7M84_005578 [Penaeus vannamei]|uniref:Uncharacterized protein n=1 Tax=Penaeus vannamei TaxID=6689 RepID=A0A423THF6_PENVA|nr:hypothetical protein C7M84_005578 [Penaeus vannamei]